MVMGVRGSTVRRAGRALLAAAAFGALVIACSPAPQTGAQVGEKVGGLVEPTPDAGLENLPPLGAAATPEIRALYEGAFEGGSSGEPGWSFELDDTIVIFKRDNLPPDSGLTPRRSYFEQGARIQAGALVVTLKAEPCTPAAGREEQPYSVSVLFEGVTFDGCARRSTGEPRVARRWSDQLPALLPAIDACLARAEAKPARITIASERDEGEGAVVVVRLREADNGRAECTAAVDGSGASYVANIADNDRLVGEDDPIFVRAPAAQPRGRCAAAPALGPDGAQLGWLIPRRC